MSFFECRICGGAYGIGAGCICPTLPPPPKTRMEKLLQDKPERLPALFKARGRLLREVSNRLTAEINRNVVATDLLTRALIELVSVEDANIELINEIRKYIKLGTYDNDK